MEPRRAYYRPASKRMEYFAAFVRRPAAGKRAIHPLSKYFRESTRFFICGPLPSKLEEKAFRGIPPPAQPVVSGTKKSSGLKRPLPPEKWLFMPLRSFLR